MRGKSDKKLVIKKLTLNVLTTKQLGVVVAGATSISVLVPMAC